MFRDLTLRITALFPFCRISCLDLHRHHHGEWLFCWCLYLFISMPNSSNGHYDEARTSLTPSVNSRTWKGEPTGVAWVSKEITCWGYQLSDMTSWFGSDWCTIFIDPLLNISITILQTLDLLLRHGTPWLDLRCQLIVLTICHKMVSIFESP